jgi:hypothetical protein
MQEPYQRVIPRDFFNEAKLLKCMGLLSLKIHDCKTPCEITIHQDQRYINETMDTENGEPFDVVLMDCGHLTVINYPVTVKGVQCTFKTTYNSKSNFPFYCEHDYCDYLVFDEKGNFDDEFLNFVNQLPCKK